MKKKLTKYISPILTVVILILFGLYLYRNPDIIKVVLDTKPKYLLIIILIFISVFFLEGLFIRVTLKAFNKDISIKESFYLSTLSRIGNYLLPMRAGAIFRATYLKKKYNFDYSKFLSTLYGYYIILFLLYSFVAIITLLFKSFLNDEIFYILIIFFSGLFLAMLFLMFVRVPFKKFVNNREGLLAKIVGFLDRFMKSWDVIVKNKKLLLQLIFITFQYILLNTIIIYVEFLSLGITINFLNLMLYSCLSGVSLLISLTPGSLGIREAVFLISSDSIGLDQEQILQLAVIDRGILFILLMILMIVIFLFLRKFNLRDVYFAKKEN
jgi:uncharacterized protein (TIRG00374 family)